MQCRDMYKYLGIQLNNTLSWNTHIITIVNKATRMLNFIKRNLSKCSDTIKSTAYATLVRPILEYATKVWDPHHKFLIHKIEMVQRRATRWVLTDYRLLLLSLSILVRDTGHTKDKARFQSSVTAIR